MLIDNSRGPEIECWFGTDDGEDPAVTNDWSYLPFMAMSDGVHTYSNPQSKLFRDAQCSWYHQLHRRLLLLHATQERDRSADRNVLVRHLMRASARLERAPLPTRRCHAKYGAEGSGGGGGEPALLWPIEGEAEHGHDGLVCTEVSGARLGDKGDRALKGLFRRPS